MFEIGTHFKGPKGESRKNTQVAHVTPLPKRRKEVKATMINGDLERDKLILKEVRRLKSIYKDVPKQNKSIIEGLIKRAAYMLITLEEMERDLSDNGYVEYFSQSEKTEPYERERPVARLYNTMNKNYQSIIKQLSDLVPKPEKIIDKNDGFEEFVNGRDD